jgi:hypothetical protein
LGDKTPKEAFTGVKPKVGHLRIFGCPVYIHEPEEKRTKGMFVGYNETSEAYKIFIPAQQRTVVSRDVKFEEDFASRKSHETLPVTEDEEQEAPKVESRSSSTSSAGSQPSGEEEERSTPSSSVRRPRWFMQTLRDAKEHVEAPSSTFRESRPPKKFPNYMALMSSIIDSESSSVQEATDQQVWRNAMMEDDVWDIVPGSEGQPVPGGSSRSSFLAKREC